MKNMGCSLRGHVEGKIERKISKFKNLLNFDLLLGRRDQGDFYCERHAHAWTTSFEAWAILRENQLRSSLYGCGGKSESHAKLPYRNDMCPWLELLFSLWYGKSYVD